MKIQTDKITVKCYAKVNLTLDVKSRRSDGYHEVEMIMQQIGIYDTLTVSAHSGCGIHISCTDSRIPCDGGNLAARAAKLFLETVGEDAEVGIHIEKNIPVGAGLGGGSSDAAGVLRALNKVFGEPLSCSGLAELGGKIGADVPFFIYGGAMLASGIGTELSEVEPLDVGTMVVAKPEFEVITAHVYKSLVLDEGIAHPDTRGALAAIRRGDIKGLAACGGNVLETVTAAKHREIGEYKKVMTDCGADYALMSGSGPSVFGIFKNSADAEKAAAVLKNSTREVFVTHTVTG